MSTSTDGRRFALAERTRYRYESDLDMFMLYNADNEEFRVAGALAYDIVAGIEEGMAVSELAERLEVDQEAVNTFCEECLESGFIEEM